MPLPATKSYGLTGNYTTGIPTILVRRVECDFEDDFEDDFSISIATLIWQWDMTT